MKPRDTNPTYSISSLKRTNTLSRFHPRMTEDLEETLKKLARLPRDENTDLTEIPSDLIVSVPVQLVCTVALVAVLALPVSYLVSSHLREEQHYARILSLEHELYNMQSACNTNNCSFMTIEGGRHKTLQKSHVFTTPGIFDEDPTTAMQDSPTSQPTPTNISEEPQPDGRFEIDVTTSEISTDLRGIQNMQPRPRTTTAGRDSNETIGNSSEIVAQQTNDLVQLNSYTGDGHVTILPLEMIYFRLSIANILLDTTHNNATNTTDQNIDELPISARLNLAHRFLLTTFLDPITWHGLHRSKLFSCNSQQSMLIDLNCTTPEDHLLTTNLEASFCRLSSLEASSVRDNRFWSSHLEHHNNESCSSVKQYLDQIQLAIRLLRWLQEIDLNDGILTNGDQDTYDVRIELMQKLTNGLRTMAEVLFADMERTAVDMNHTRLWITYSCVVVYVLAMFLALPTFFCLTLRTRQDLRVVSMASRQTLECLSGRVDILDNYFLRLVPKCLLKTARKRKSKTFSQKDEQHREQNIKKDAKLLRYWLKVKLALCESRQDTPELEDSRHQETLQKNSRDSYTVRERTRKHPRPSRNQSESCGDERLSVKDETGYQYDVAQSSVNSDTTHMHADPPGLKTVYVQSAATHSDLISRHRATPFASLLDSPPRDGTSPSTAMPVASTSDLSLNKQVHAGDSSVFKEPNESESPQIGDKLPQLQARCPDIKCEEKSESSGDIRSPDIETGDPTAVELGHPVFTSYSNSPQSQGLSLVMLSPLPERHRSAPSLLGGSTQNNYQSIFYTSTSCQDRSPPVGYIDTSREALSAPTICLSWSVPEIQQDPSNATPLTLISLTNSVGCSSQTIFSVQKSEYLDMKSSNPSLPVTAESPPEAKIDLVSATSTAGARSEISDSPGLENKEAAYQVEVPPESSCYSSSQTGLPYYGDKSSNSQISQHLKRSVVKETREHLSADRCEFEERIPKSPSNSHSSPAFLRQVSVLAVTVPEMKTVLDLASRDESLTILTQLTDLLLERMQQYDVFLVEQNMFTFTFGSGSHDSKEAKHIQEVASLALDLMSSFGDLEIDYSCDKKIRPKMGIHTGPCVAFIPSTGHLRCRLVGNVVQHAVDHMELAFPHSILASARTCDQLKTAKAPFELTKREYHLEEPRFLQRSRFLSGHLNDSGVWADGNSQAPSLYHLITRPKYSFDSDDLYTPTRQRSPYTVQGHHRHLY